MGLRVNTNSASINAQRNLSSVTDKLSGNFRRLSTGLRISTASDDAAGLAISERLRSQVRSLDQAKRNANDGISLVQTAEGALNEVSSILTRLRELAIQSSNGSVSNQDKETLDEEFQSLVGEVNRIGRSTEFSGIKLLDGSSSSVSFQVGFGTTSGIDTISVSLSAGAEHDAVAAIARHRLGRRDHHGDHQHRRGDQHGQRRCAVRSARCRTASAARSTTSRSRSRT
jgi:flagellin